MWGFDARRMGTPLKDVPYKIEAQVRGESVSGVSLAEQRERQHRLRRHVIGEPHHIAWFWGAMSGICGVSALLVAMG